MKSHITTIVSTIVIGTFFAVAHADATTSVAASAVTHSTRIDTNSPQKTERAESRLVRPGANLVHPGTPLQHERAVINSMEKREAYLKAHKDMKAAAIEGKRINEEKAEIVKLKKEVPARKTNIPAHGLKKNPGAVGK